MASDAKIGLLLGLVFIFIIALIINGLPSFNESGNNNELTTNMVNSQNKPTAIAAKERGIINLREPVEARPVKLEPTLSPPVKQDVHFTSAPQSPSAIVVKENPIEQAIAAAAAQAVARRDETGKTELSRAHLSKTYVVSEGDSLASIAKKFYGSEEGNKNINIARIFEANRKLLKSPDEIYVGQKLIIPPLSTPKMEKGKTADVFSGKEFVKVDSIGSRHLLTNARRPEKSDWYVVRQGDSLWQIAADRLGDGSRCSEIAELNAGILDNEDSLSIGMRLRIPPR
jgi:nucleoid-associated protein YgaU